MKVTGFVGSPNKSGNTAAIVQKVLEGAAGKGAETKIFNLNSMAIKGCQACGQCREIGSKLV
ncbi:MAG: NAD(P)H-dependent oxidoreductase [Clostridiales bacterium]|jgi:multimeric flavodoxin WrbA|nr:NAD(P)H-dependent oxidoreductase [Eubacteriales bacterium]MDH7566050.1 NAD(P)H-dependent oxidoreductase [Clostridiales bacterium]